MRKYNLKREAAWYQGEVMAYGECLIYIDDLIGRYAGNSTTADTVLLLLKDKLSRAQYSALQDYNNIKVKWDK